MATIELCDEQLSAIVNKELSTQLRYFKEDLKKGSVGVFSHDPTEERKEIKRLIKSFERVLDYYGSGLL